MQVNQYSICFIEKGLAGVSMSMIADKIGIKKPSLYKHFSSKDEIVEAMYQFLREQSKKNANINHQEKLLTFYKVIYSERSIQPMAARIVAEETERMIIATKQLFYAMEIHKLLHFDNADMSAVSFAMTVHGLMDYELDQKYGYDEESKNLLDEYLKWFCTENQVEAGD